MTGGARRDEEDEAGARRTTRTAVAALALVYVALRLWRLTDSCLWFDEIFGVHAARHTWGQMLRFVAADVIHPPLFYALLKIWTAAGGESLAWLRLLPVVLSCLALVPLVLLCRELRLTRAETCLALLLAALNGYLIKYAQEVRMYSLLLLLSLTSLLLFVKFYNSTRDSYGRLAALFAANLLLVHTHYYGWLVVAAELVFPLLARTSRRKLFGLAAQAALVGVCFAPWVYAVAGAAPAGGGLAQNIGWITRPGLAALAQLYLTANELIYFQQASHEPPHLRLALLLGPLVFGLPLLALAWRRTNNDGRTSAGDSDTSTVSGAEIKSDFDANADSGAGVNNVNAVLLLAFFAALPVALAFVLSLALPYSVWGARHLVVAVAPYLILVGVALARLRPRWLRTALLALLGCWLLMNASYLLLRGRQTYVWCAWEPLARRIVEDARTHDEPARDRATLKVYAFEEAAAYHVWFALSSTREGRADSSHAARSSREERFSVEVIKNVPGLAEDPAYFLPRAFAGVRTRAAGEAIGEDFFYVAFRDSAWRPDRPPLKFLSERGYEAGPPFELRTKTGAAFVAPVRRAPPGGR
ncbi:MAG TPA: glycosyltransferase family 39 protein [Pyrinomonadaceae bacterium]|nr:glycosyltransferase family 39 protein [Pyrinomonadaceae bacterium]